MAGPSWQHADTHNGVVMSQSTRVKAGSAASVLEQPHLDVHEERVCVEEAELKGPTPTQLHEDPLAVLRRHRNTHSSGPSKPRAQHEDAPTPRTTFPRRVLVSAPPHSPPQAQVEEPPEAVQVDVLGVDEDPPADERADEESLAFVMLFEFLFEQDGEKLLHVERMDAFAVWWYVRRVFPFLFLRVVRMGACIRSLLVLLLFVCPDP